VTWACSQSYMGARTCSPTRHPPPARPQSPSKRSTARLPRRAPAQRPRSRPPANRVSGAAGGRGRGPAWALESVAGPKGRGMPAVARGGGREHWERKETRKSSAQRRDAGCSCLRAARVGLRRHCRPTARTTLQPVASWLLLPLRWTLIPPSCPATETRARPWTHRTARAGCINHRPRARKASATALDAWDPAAAGGGARRPAAANQRAPCGGRSGAGGRQGLNVRELEKGRGRGGGSRRRLHDG
jgi:hypothetical protein